MIKNSGYFLILVLISACTNAQTVQQKELTLYPENFNGWVLNRFFQPSYFDTSYSLILNNHRYNIELIVPEKNNHQLILYLPGWNLPSLDWKSKTSVIDSALANGYSILLVDMGKSIYLDTFYTNTRSDYLNHPTRQWLWNVVLKPYKDAGFFSDVNKGLKTHIFGLSTGARGAIALVQDHPSTVNFVAALSGDYYPTLDTTDALMINAMGRYYKNQLRWNIGSNNLLPKKNSSSVFFIAHGRKDKIVPFGHSIAWVESAKKLKDIKVYTYFPEEAEHNYVFWNEAGLIALNQLKALYP